MMKQALASIVFTVYNQEQYVRESLLSALIQSYEPLEIVVSDDGSSDGTCEIIDAVLEESGFNQISAEVSNPQLRVFEKGAKTVVVNFNSVNRGICANFEYAFGLTHGELVFTFGGDDVSMPDRVKKVMATWLVNDKRARVVASGGWLMDVEGRCYREYRREVLDGAPIGAFNAYARSVYDDFPRIDSRLAKQTYEDSVYGLRAQFFGPPAYYDELLVRYRFGSGVSTGGAWRAKSIRGARAVKASCEQLLIDLESVKLKMSEKTYVAKRQEFESRIQHEIIYLQCLESNSFRRRLCAFFEHGYCRMGVKAFLIGLILLLPRRLGDYFLAKV